jgi:hypothetical protein
VIIRHKSFKDVCCEIIEYHPDICLVEWINMGFVNSWYLDRISTIQIKDVSEWEKYSTHQQQYKCLRYGTWIPL